MPTYQFTFYFKSKFGNNDSDHRRRQLNFRAVSDEEAIKKVEKMIAKNGRFYDANRGFVLKRGRVYRKTKIVKEMMFKPTTTISFSIS